MSAAGSAIPDVASLFLVACDLDRTLIYSAAALGLAGPDDAAPRLVVAEVYESAPLSYLTRRADALLGELAAAAVLVPTTTRTMAQFARVRLLDAPPAFAVTTNGARILVDGRPDEDWAASVTAVLAAGSAPLPEVAEYVGKVADPLWTRSFRIAEDRFCYLVVNRAELPAAFVGDLASWCAPLGWTVSLQGRKIYAVPGGLTKVAAVAEIARRVGAGAVLAAGDSLLDADMLEAADFGVRPAHGELHDLGWARPRVAVTDAAGVLAGEEILDRLLAEVAARAARAALPAG